MFNYDVAQVMAEDRRKAYEREAEIHRWLREAEARSPRSMRRSTRYGGARRSRQARRAALSTRVLYGVGRLLVRVGSRLQRSYSDRVGMVS
jgi:hypothetical protein